jgi:hypothetical protein
MSVWRNVARAARADPSGSRPCLEFLHFSRGAVAPPSWRINAGWKQALNGRFGRYLASGFLPVGKKAAYLYDFSYRQENGVEFS